MVNYALFATFVNACSTSDFLGTGTARYWLFWTYGAVGCKKSMAFVFDAYDVEFCKR